MAEPPLEARRLHPLSPLMAAVPVLRRLALPLLVVVLGDLRVAGLAVVVGAAVLMGTVISTRRTRYLLDDDELVVWRGVLNRTTQVVSPMRVQQVEVLRQLRHRAVGLAAVQIDLVGGGGGRGGNRVVLDALEDGEAERVREVLERGRRGLTATAAPLDIPPPPPAALLRLSTRQLVVGGLTGAPLLLVPVALLSVIDELSDLAGTSVGDDIAGSSGVVPALALVVLAIVVWPAVAAAIMIFRFHGYELARSGGDLVVKRGLLETRTSVIPIQRVQLAHRSAWFARRWFGLASLDVRTASAASDGGGSWVTTVPIGDVGAIEALVPIVMQREHVGLDVTAHPAAARRRAITRRLVAMVGPLAVGWSIAVLASESHPAAVAGGGGALLVAAVVAVLWGRAWYRSLGHSARDGLLIARDGVIVHHVRVVVIDRIQSVRIDQSPWQRRAGVCSVAVQLAGPVVEVGLRDASPEQAAALASLVRGLASVDLPHWQASLSPA